MANSVNRRCRSPGSAKFLPKHVQICLGSRSTAEPNHFHGRFRGRWVISSYFLGRSNLHHPTDGFPGGCCLLSNIELKSQGMPQPAAGILVSPWFDMSLKSFVGGCAFVETDYIITANEGVPYFAKRWVGNIKGTSPEVNPLYCDTTRFEGLPPQLMLVGGGDFVLPECRELDQLFTSAGLPHQFVIEWGQIHLYALGSKWIDPEIRTRTDGAIFGWIMKHVKV